MQIHKDQCIQHNKMVPLCSKMILVWSCTSSHHLSKSPSLISAATVGPPHNAPGGQSVTFNPSWPVLLVPLMRQSRTCALLSVLNTSRYERLHNKLSLICISDAIMLVLVLFFLAATSSASLSLATSESVFQRKAAPRQLGIQDAASSHQCSLNYFCFKSATNFHIMASVQGDLAKM